MVVDVPPTYSVLKTDWRVDDEFGMLMLDAVKVVKFPVDGTLTPIAVPLMPVAVVLKFPEVKTRLLAPAEIDEVPRPDNASAPEVAVRFNGPVVRVRPLYSVASPVDWKVDEAPRKLVK